MKQGKTPLVLFAYWAGTYPTEVPQKMTKSQDPTPKLPSWDIALNLDRRPPLDPYRQDFRGRPLDDTLTKCKMTEIDINAARSSTWLPQGPTEQGFLTLPDRASEHVRAKAPPSVATHRGQLWAVWTDFDGATYYATTTPESHGEEFGARSRFPDYGHGHGDGNGKVEGIPAIANLNGVLHGVVVSAATGRMAHYVYDSDDQLTWVRQDGLPDGCVAGDKTRDPALVAFHNKLFLAYVGADGGLFHTVFNIHSQTWSAPGAVAPSGLAPPEVGGDSSGTTRLTFQGAPALFVLNGALHLLCESATGSAEIVGYRYDFTESGWAWSPTDDVSEGKAARGVSAASFGAHAYLGFIANDAVYVAAHKDGSAWGSPERVGGHDVKARFPPQIAVMNGRVHCVFAGKWKGDLHWFSRPVLGYDLKTWLGSVPDDTWLSAMTVPGTHDSCARSNVPFVRTQYLSIAQQLALGLRFFDLRLRRHDDGKLYCYHGGMPIGLPKGLSFDDVMGQVWNFIGPRDGKKATETVLISINNDDKSKEQKAHPQTFYNAVREAIGSTPTWDDGSKRWYSEPVTAKLGDVRGKAVLLRRYYGDPDVKPVERMGLDLEKWLDDNPDSTIETPTGVKLRLQDKWKYAKRCELHDLVSSKQEFVQEMMKRATGVLSDSAETDKDTNPEKTWFINFCSAVGDPVEHGEVAEAKWIAVGAHSDFHFFGNWVEGMNVRTRDYLRGLGAGKKRLGVVNLDYPELPEDSDLVARLIETNFSS